MRPLPLVLLAVVFVACNSGPKTTPLKLPSGKLVKLLRSGPMKLGDGSRVLTVQYQSELTIADSPSLRAEAEEVLGVATPEADKQGITSVVVSANSPQTGIVSTGRAFNYVFRKGPDGRWTSPGSPTPEKATISNLKFGKQSMVNGRMDVSEETTDLPLVYGGAKSATEFQNVFGPCFDFKGAPATAHAWLLLGPPAGTPMPPDTELHDGKAKIPVTAMNSGHVCQYNYFTPGDLPGEWTFELYFDNAPVKSWKVRVTR